MRIYRFSTYEDLQGIKNLVMRCFGDRERFGLYKNLEGRYILCVDDITGKIIGMSGLDDTDEYVGGKEVRYSCVDPDYRNCGIMSELIGRVIDLAASQGVKRVYCSAWRLSNRPWANLHFILEEHGFYRVVKNRASWKWGYNCNNTCNPTKEHYCVQCTENGCFCCEDLYYKEI